MAAAASVEETAGQQMKYILVTGGVISGIGKGIIASSMGALLKAVGFRVTSIKIDPYINIDAGTFSPYEHGEVFVLDDGGEVDLDLGNYERYLDVTLHRDNNITTGKIYQQVISDERAGRYLGKTVQVVPHVTDAIMAWVERVARVPVEHADGPDDVRAPEICIIELGGTIGDIEGMPFVEAFRQFQFRVGRENFCCVHVSLVPQPSSTGEQKTKPTQASVRELRGLGLYPDIVACRSEKPIGPEVKAKLSNFCHVAKEQVICLHDVHSLYAVPSMLAEEGCLDTLCKRLQLQLRSDLRLRRCLAPWRLLAERQAHVRQSVSIALVGKYTQLQDSYASVIKALEHAALRANRRLQLVCIEAEHLEEGVVDPAKYYEAWRQLVDTQGVLVPGGFGSRGAHGKMAAIRWARTHRRPFLGVCLGMQLAVVEFARAQLGLTDANSTEFDPEPADRLVVDMPEHNPGQMGGTMRLGRRTTRFSTDDSLLRRLYGGAELVHERHRHRYEVNPEYVQRLEAAGMRFVGQGQDDGAGNKRMEVLELQGHPFFIGVQFHPEYLTRPDRPSPPYLGLLMASCGKLGVFLTRGCRLSPPRVRRESIGDTSDDEDQLVYKMAASCVTPVSEIESPTTDEPTNCGDGSAICNVK